ncbi:3-hydroxyacyl-CoA dehydrogenase family protein [Paenibacillus sp. 2TAF8]|uniref:3-hydroxyacyl-CoA dehydrogenase family protein n=1 Tax=Paenibacillus sp. 2TAF8 TaxID=3233020 RepID=UPI003F9C4C6C
MSLRISVVGAGVMGTGITHFFSQSGYSVRLVDLSESILDNAKQQIKKQQRMSTLLGSNKSPALKQGKTEFTLEISDIADSDFIVECVTEDWEAKKRVYQELDKYVNDKTTILANTSCISITKIASLLRYPHNVIGVHFMNPVMLIEGIEVIKGYHTSPSTLSKTTVMLENLGKKCIVVNDFPGFVSNRISHLFMNEAAFIVQDQVAEPSAVDQIFKSCYGHKMGPLETADLIGLDTVVSSLKVLYNSYQDSKFRCCPLLQRMVDAGMYGVKSGEGFYKYR